MGTSVPGVESVRMRLRCRPLQAIRPRCGAGEVRSLRAEPEGALGSPIAKPGSERSEGVVRSQAVFHAAGERRVGRRLPLLTHVNRLDPEIEATGITVYADRGLARGRVKQEPQGAEDGAGLPSHQGPLLIHIRNVRQPCMDPTPLSTAPERREALAAPRGRAKGFSGTVSPWWILVTGIFLVVFFIAPIVNNVLNTDALATLAEKRSAGFYYAKLFTDPYYLKIVWITVLLSVGVTLLCVAIGYPVALFLVRHAGKWSGLVIFLLIAPLLTSIIMRTFGWRVIFARRGMLNDFLLGIDFIERPISFLNGPGSVVVGLVHVLVPFMVLSIASVLRSIDPHLEESARILGANRVMTFLKVTLPLSLDGIGTGFIIVFLLANGSFVTLLLLGGGELKTLPLLIYQQFTISRDFQFAAAMSNVLLAIAVGCLYLQLRLIRRKGVRG